MKQPYEIERTDKQLEDKMISRIKDLGRIQERLQLILDDDVFDALFKHNPYWDSIHGVEACRLEHLRRKLACLHDNLWDVIAIIKDEEDL